MKLVVTLNSQVLNSLLATANGKYPLIMFWKDKAIATDGNVVRIEKIDKVFPRTVYVHKKFFPKLLGTATLQLRLKDEQVHVRVADRVTLVENSPSDSFPDIVDLIKREKEQRDKSVVFSMQASTLRTLLACAVHDSKTLDGFITFKVHDKHTIARWKTKRGRGYFAQATVVEG